MACQKITLDTYIGKKSVTAAEVAEDSSLLAVAFSDSAIKVWSLVPQKLRMMKDGEQLADVEREAGNFSFCTNKFYVFIKRLVVQQI